MMRANARYQDVAITGTRGLSKTYSEMLGEEINGVVWPGTRVLYTGPALKQLSDIGSKTHADLAKSYPCITKHWRIAAESKDDFRITTDYGSSFYRGDVRLWRDVTVRRGRLAYNHKVLDG